MGPHDDEDDDVDDADDDDDDDDDGHMLMRRKPKFPKFLLVHGRNDTMVPFSASVRMQEALERGRIDVSTSIS